MNIFLKDIDIENWKECIFLTTNKDGKHFIYEEGIIVNSGLTPWLHLHMQVSICEDEFYWGGEISW